MNTKVQTKKKSPHSIILRKNIGRTVYIDWKNPAYDWHYFSVVDVKDSCVKLKGEYDPELRGTHIGNVFWCSVNGILKITQKN